MTFNDVINQRYSCRSFSSQSIAQEKIDRILVVGCRPSEAWVRRYDGKNGAEVDAAIVSTYLMLAAENEGLATLWVGSFDPALLREILPGAEEYELIAMINIGYPAADSKPSAMHDSRKPMDELVTRVD